MKLSEVSNEPIVKREVDCLMTYELENSEFLFGMTIWYEILSAINSTSKNMKSKYICIDITIE